MWFLGAVEEGIQRRQQASMAYPARGDWERAAEWCRLVDELATRRERSSSRNRVTDGTLHVDAEYVVVIACCG